MEMRWCNNMQTRGLECQFSQSSRTRSNSSTGLLYRRKEAHVSYLDCQRRPLFHTRPNEGSQLASVCELWSKFAPTLFGGSFFSFSCSPDKRKKNQADLSTHKINPIFLSINQICAWCFTLFKEVLEWRANLRMSWSSRAPLQRVILKPGRHSTYNPHRPETQERTLSKTCSGWAGTVKCIKNT